MIEPNVTLLTENVLVNEAGKEETALNAVLQDILAVNAHLRVHAI